MIPLRIMMTTGIADMDAAGNQSLRNTVRYLAEQGSTIHLLTAMPSGLDILASTDGLPPGVILHRGPAAFKRLFLIAKRVKDAFTRPNRSNDSNLSTLPKSDNKVGYYDEYTLWGRLFFAGFLFIYVPLEFVRAVVLYARYRPDLFYGVNGPGSVMATILGKVFRKPVVHRWQGSSYTEEDVRYLRSTVRGRLLMLDGGFAKGWPSDAVIMTNDGTRGDRILKMFGVSPERIFFWMNGIETLEQRPTREEARRMLGMDERPVVLMVSRLVLWKRVDRGIRAMKHVTADPHLRDAVMIIVGTGNEETRLRALVKTLDLESSVRILGARSHSEVLSLYAAADVFVSVYDVSNRGNPILEAMQAGVPIVSLQDGSLDGLLEDGVSARLISSDQVSEELPTTIIDLLRDEPLRRRLGTGAKAAADAHLVNWSTRIQWEHNVLLSLVQRETQVETGSRGRR